MRVVIALGVVFLSGCVTQQLQHTLDDAVKIEAACAAVDKVLPNSGPTVSEVKKQIASRFIPPSCELQNGGINWGSDGCFAIVSEITSDTELDLGSTAKELQAIKSDATKLKPDIDSAVAALDEMFAGIKADTNFCSSSQNRCHRNAGVAPHRMRSPAGSGPPGRCGQGDKRPTESAH